MLADTRKRSDRFFANSKRISVNLIMNEKKNNQKPSVARIHNLNILKKNRYGREERKCNQFGKRNNRSKDRVRIIEIFNVSLTSH